MSDSRKSNWEGEGLTPMITEMRPVSPRMSSIYPENPYGNHRMQEYQPLQKKPWTPEPPPKSAPKSPASNTKTLVMLFVLGTLIGVVICGIPLAVIATLYAQGNSQSCSNNSSNTGTSNSSGTTLPSQCSSYTTISDATRNVGYGVCGVCSCDSGLAAGWYQFISPAGTQLATTIPSTGYCGATYPGWFNGSFPTTVGGLTTGTVCVNYAGNLCYSPYSVSAIMVTNCGSFYVFYLRPMVTCSLRYCIA